MARKKGKVKSIKKEADKVFSIYIRQKYAKEGCYTCGKHKGEWKNLQNGHFISRSYLSTRYDERNCRPQCVGCNVFGGGKPVEFAKRLDTDCLGLTARLYKKAQEIIPNFDYQFIIDSYTQKLKEL